MWAELLGADSAAQRRLVGGSCRLHAVGQRLPPRVRRRALGLEWTEKEGFTSASPTLVITVIHRLLLDGRQSRVQPVGRFVIVAGKGRKTHLVTGPKPEHCPVVLALYTEP